MLTPTQLRSPGGTSPANWFPHSLSSVDAANAPLAAQDMGKRPVS